MKINNLNISAFKAKLINRQASTQNINSITDWLDNAINGTVLRQNYEFKTLGLTFLITDETEDLAYKDISGLTEALKKADLVFDDISLVFPCVLQGSSNPERVHNSQFKITYLLKNDWGVGQQVEQEFNITPANAKRLEVNYKTDWSESVGYYKDCFTDDEIYQELGTDVIYVDLDTLEAKATEVTDWNEFFLALGIDLDKYKSENERNGFITDAEFSPVAAQDFINNHSTIEVLYRRFRKQGFADVPIETAYPSTVWTTGENNEYYFDLGVGQGWDIRDISLIVYGRYFQTLSNGSGSMFGGLGENDPFNMSLKVPDMELFDDQILNKRHFKVYNSSSQGGGGHFIIETLESISATPIRKYGLKSSNEGETAIPGFCDVIFNGITLDRIPLDSYILTGNLGIMNGKAGIGKYCDIARVQVYYKDQLMKDLIPISANVKNCFVNDYDAGLYDINTMEFIPWKKGEETGAEPQNLMPIPSVKPPIPPAKKFDLTVNKGTGTGKYLAGTVVPIEAEAAPTGQIFDKWTIQEGNPTIEEDTKAKTNLTLVDKTEITATYKEKPVIEPHLLYYAFESYINDETYYNENAKPWAKSTYDDTPGCGPAAYDYCVAVYEGPALEPGKQVQWRTSNPSKIKPDHTGTDKYGRPYGVFNAYSTRSQCRIDFEYTDGTRIATQSFFVKSV